MAKYHYKGPVMLFGKWAGDFEGETIANSEAEARRNLTYQAKKKFNRIPGAQLGLPGKITKISEIERSRLA